MRTPSPFCAPPPWVVRSILAAIHDIISRAQRQILLATYGMNSVVDRPKLLLDSLQKVLHTRLVEVSLLVRAQ